MDISKNKIPDDRLLDVPCREKEIAKSIGAKWCNDIKKWYVPDDIPVGYFTRWLIALKNIDEDGDRYDSRYWHDPDWK